MAVPSAVHGTPATDGTGINDGATAMPFSNGATWHPTMALAQGTCTPASPAPCPASHVAPHESPAPSVTLHPVSPTAPCSRHPTVSQPCGPGHQQAPAPGPLPSACLVPIPLVATRGAQPPLQSAVLEGHCPTVTPGVPWPQGAAASPSPQPGTCAQPHGTSHIPGETHQARASWPLAPPVSETGLLSV